MLKFLRLIVIFALGAILGPVLIAGIAAAMPPFGNQLLPPKDAEIGKLVQAYRSQLPVGRLFMTVIPPPDGKECGYEPEKVFPGGWDSMIDSHRSGQFSDYAGYYALHKWREGSEDDGFIEAIREQLGKDLSRFESGFLGRCIQSTVFASQCMAKVEAIGAKVRRFDPKRQSQTLAGGHEDNIVCLYVDGVAARHAIRLSPPFSQQFADSHRHRY